MNNKDVYVSADEHGALRIAGSRVMLDSVLAAWGQGHSPETIHSQFPELTLEEIYGALTWSLAHRDDVTAYLKRQDAVWEQWRRRSESQQNPLRDRLRAKQHAGAK